MAARAGNVERVIGFLRHESILRFFSGEERGARIARLHYGLGLLSEQVQFATAPTKPGAGLRPGGGSSPPLQRKPPQRKTARRRARRSLCGGGGMGVYIAAKT